MAGSPEFLRATVTLDMDLDSAADMVCNFTHERNNWDDFMTGAPPAYAYTHRMTDRHWALWLSWSAGQIARW